MPRSVRQRRAQIREPTKLTSRSSCPMVQAWESLTPSTAIQLHLRVRVNWAQAASLCQLVSVTGAGSYSIFQMERRLPTSSSMELHRGEKTTLWRFGRSRQVDCPNTSRDRVRPVRSKWRAGEAVLPWLPPQPPPRFMLPVVNPQLLPLLSPGRMGQPHDRRVRIEPYSRFTLLMSKTVGEGTSERSAPTATDTGASSPCGPEAPIKATG